MAFDYFLRIDGIPGESADAKHKGEIEVQSWTWGESNPGAPAVGGGAGAGKVQMGDLSVIAPFSKASPNLLLACAMGKHLKSAVLSGRRAGGKQADFLTFSLADVLVSSYQTGAVETDVPATDAVALSFSRIVVEYKEQKADGSPGASVKAGWDRKTNKRL